MSISYPDARKGATGSGTNLEEDDDLNLCNLKAVPNIKRLSEELCVWGLCAWNLKDYEVEEQKTRRVLAREIAERWRVRFEARLFGSSAFLILIELRTRVVFAICQEI
ncbi:uncharacterized protein LOC130786870 [Actinidia eriantha]|uniref:uncharacterized protein LOC130786870 n=1 Tax=Actinidia eriantha TaxID=165200 RepID=UPI00258880F0|nr:uncharacterized protein LOC130786870 [Actinidia eriantha]